MDWQEIETEAAELALTAGEILKKYFVNPGSQNDHLRVQFKDQNNSDPVTLADTEIQETLSKCIKERHPEHGILGEEGLKVEGNAPDTVWVIDPLDGTRNFIHGLPLFACAIGVLFKGKPVVGAIFIPWPMATPGIVLHSSVGNGFRIDNELITGKEPSKFDANGLITLPGSFSNSFRFEGNFSGKSGELRMGGSIAYEMALVAMGITQYAVISSAYLWDIAAGVCIIRESGGQAVIGTSTSGLSAALNKPELWKELEGLVTPWVSSETTYETMRRRTQPMLVAHSSILGEISPNIGRKQFSVQRLSKFLFSV